MNNIAGFGPGTNNPRGGGGGGAPQQEGGCGEMIAKMWDGVPMFNRFIFWTSLLIYLTSFFFPSDKLLMNHPPLVYMGFQVWRLFTAPFANMTIFMLLFGLMSYMPRGCQVERSKGTSHFILYFLIMSLISMVIMTLLDVFAMNFFGLMSISLGLWTMVLFDMTVDSLKDPDLERNLC